MPPNQSITKRYWVIFWPWLVLMGFVFGAGGLLFFFCPSYYIYQAHRRKWTLLKTSALAVILTIGWTYVDLMLRQHLGQL